MVVKGLKQAARGSFPRFEDAELNDHPACNGGVPELEPLSDESDSDCDGQHQSSSKADEDVLMFLKLAESMSIDSLLFILQGHARSMHNIPEGQLQSVLERAKKNNQQNKKHPAAQKRKTKKLRFAEIMGGQQIRVEVNEIPHFNTFTAEEKRNQWWTSEEQRRMRSSAAQVVKHFRRNKLAYIEGIELLADSYLAEVKGYEVEQEMKRLAQDFIARGLETNIVKSLCEDAQASVQAVLNEQRKQQQAIASDQRLSAEQPEDDPLECIRKKYQHFSMPSRTLAKKLAEWDHVEALKASISKWGQQKLQEQKPKMSRWDPK